MRERTAQLSQEKCGARNEAKRFLSVGLISLNRLQVYPCEVSTTSEIHRISGKLLAFSATCTAPALSECSLYLIISCFSYKMFKVIHNSSVLCCACMRPAEACLFILAKFVQRRKTNAPFSQELFKPALQTLTTKPNVHVPLL